MGVNEFTDTDETKKADGDAGGRRKDRPAKGVQGDPAFQLASELWSGEVRADPPDSTGLRDSGAEEAGRSIWEIIQRYERTVRPGEYKREQRAIRKYNEKRKLEGEEQTKTDED